MQTVKVMATVLASLVATNVFAKESGLSDGRVWGGRISRPAVVNPVVMSPLQEVISLRGGWDFTADPQTNGLAAGWMRPGAAWPAPRRIQVPGCWEAQGIGEPGISQPWDMNDRSPYPLRHVYMGSAWYRRTVKIPAAWQRKRIWLKVGAVRSQGWFWVNGKPVAHDYTFCSVNKYDITDYVTPGQEAVVCAQVRNDLPSRKGSTGWRHRAGGLYRDVELEATPETGIDNAWVFGDFDTREAAVHVTVTRAGEAGSLKQPVLKVSVRPAEQEDARPREPSGAERIKQAPQTGSMPVTFPDGQPTADVVVHVKLAPFMPWSPEAPSLYVAEITLCDGETPIHGWRERFGVRKLESRDGRFYLNDKPFFIRGYGDDHIYPLTLVSPASREEHLKHLRIARAAGFNYVRLHTHCEVPEFFEAADEAGILIQAELPYNHARPGEAFPSDPKRDLKELVTHYQRYVSLATCCMGNEGGFPAPLDRELYEETKNLNPRLLVLHHDGGNNTGKNSDFRSGPTTPWSPGGFPGDAPFVAHEYLNLSVKADPRLENRFTGEYLPSLAALGLDDAGMSKVRSEFPRHMSDLDSAPRDMNNLRAELQRLQLSRAWGDACVDGGHALQRLYQKQGIESARLDPACDGYSFWTIVDVLYQAQGLFNVFWEPKIAGATAEDFRQVNGPTVLLRRADGQSPIALAGQTLSHTWWISHFGEVPLRNAKLVWGLRMSKNTLACGNLELGDVAIGDVRRLGECTFIAPSVKDPVHAVLEAALEGQSVSNRWDLWIFPARKPKTGSGLVATRSHFSALAGRYPGLCRAGTPEAIAAHVLIASEEDPEVPAALEAGDRVVLLDRCRAPSNMRLGWWLLGSQTGTGIAKHPAFGDFPHSEHLSPLWERLVKRPELLKPNDGICGAEPLMVGTGVHGYALYLSQATVGKGRLLRASGLDVLSDTPEGTYLLDAMLEYARSEDFQPKAALDPERLTARWKRTQQIFGEMNGWSRTLKSDDSRTERLFFGNARISAINFSNGNKELEWETRPAEAGSVGSAFTFRWLQTTRVSDWGPKVTKRIALSLNGKKLLTFNAGVLAQDWTEQTREASLRFTGMDVVLNATTGVMELSVPQTRVQSGAPCIIRLTAEQREGGELSTGIVEVNAADFRSARTDS